MLPQLRMPVTTTFCKMRLVTCGYLVGIAHLLLSAWVEVLRLWEFRLRAAGDVRSFISRRHSSLLTQFSSLEELVKEIISLHACKQMISWMCLDLRFCFKIHSRPIQIPFHVSGFLILHIVSASLSCRGRGLQKRNQTDRFIDKVICLLLVFFIKKKGGVWKSLLWIFCLF